MDRDEWFRQFGRLYINFSILVTSIGVLVLMMVLSVWGELLTPSTARSLLTGLITGIVVVMAQFAFEDNFGSHEKEDGTGNQPKKGLPEDRQNERRRRINRK